MKRKSGITRQLRAAVAAALLGGIFSLSPAALALPVGGTSVGNTATISVDGKNMTIGGAAGGNLLTWVDFSIASGERVDFSGDSTYSYLNYVTGNAASDILGTLAGQGTIYLVNPNGIHIGDGASIDVGTLHLSTADLTGYLDSFDNALSAVNGATSFAGDVVNKGTLKAAQSITVEGNNITFKNVADVTAANVAMKSVGGEIHLGSTDGTGDYTNTTGTKYLYKLVGNKEELTSIKDGLSGNYMLNNDIEVGEISPLGDFTGKFDGLNYALQNISINSNAANVGLFSKNSGTIENLVLSGGSVTGSITGTSFGYGQNDSQSVGALAGQNTGIIRYVSNGNSVTGSISGQLYIGGDGNIATQYVGGLVGENAADGQILASRNIGSVAGSIEANYRNKLGHIGSGSPVNGAAVLQDVGGLAGKNAGSLAESYNIASVSGRMSSVRYMGENPEGKQVTVEEYVGGLVGENTGSIVDAYQGDYAVTGSLSAKEFAPDGNATIIEAVGGITGKNSGTIEAVYSQGTASGSKTGNDFAESVTVSFKPLVGTGTEAVNSYTENLTNAATFSAWGDKLTADGSNKNAVWRIYEGKTAPLLTAFMKRKDNIQEKPYDGTAEVGNSEVPSTSASTQQEGINWVKDITMVTPKSLTVSGEVKKGYDGNTEASLGISNLEGVVEGDAASLSLTATASYDTKNAGTGKTVTYSNLALSGDKAKNYALDKSGSLNTGIITTRDITATVANQSKTYDGQTVVENVEATLGNIVAGDSVSATASGNYADKHAGTGKNITYDSFTLSGADKDNYNLTTIGYTGKGTITARDITATVADQSKTYDGQDGGGECGGHPGKYRGRGQCQRHRQRQLYK